MQGKVNTKASQPHTKSILFYHLSHCKLVVKIKTLTHLKVLFFGLIKQYCNGVTSNLPTNQIYKETTPPCLEMSTPPGSWKLYLLHICCVLLHPINLSHLCTIIISLILECTCAEQCTGKLF